MKKKHMDEFIPNKQKRKKDSEYQLDDYFEQVQRKEPLQFNSGFANRVTNRVRIIQQTAQNDLFGSMVWSFKRIALTAAVVAVVLLSISLVRGPIDVQQLYYASSEVTLDELANPSVSWRLEEM